MKVAVIGSREAKGTDKDHIICHLPANCTEIISGGARGIDTLAQEAARALGLSFRSFLPDYAAYGRVAPLRRNVKIVEYSDYVLAFWDMRSSGTRFVIAYCLRLNKPFKIIRI